MPADDTVVKYTSIRLAVALIHDQLLGLQSCSGFNNTQTLKHYGDAVTMQSYANEFIFQLDTVGHWERELFGMTTQMEYMKI
jgi:hypothetical protein